MKLQLGEFFYSKITISTLNFGVGLNFFFLSFFTPQVSEVFFFFFKPQQRVKFFFLFFFVFCFFKNFHAPWISNGAPLIGQLGSVQKYFGGVGWAIENFRLHTFLTPLCKPQNFLNPSQHVEELFTPSPHC